MAAYVIRRIGIMLLLLLLLTLVVFVLFNLLPGDPARLYCGKTCTPDGIIAIRHKIGLDQPVLQQYWEFLRGLFVGRTLAPLSPDPIV